MTIFWLIVVVSILVFLQAWYYGRRGLSGVGYSRSFNKKKVFAGDKVELVEVLTNNRLIPIPWVRIESRISPYLRFKAQKNLDIMMDQFHKSLFFLSGYRRITRHHEITCLRRGFYDCGLTSVTAGDMFGLVSRTADINSDATLYVYPAIMKTEDMPEAALRWQGEVTVRRWILPDPILVTGIRAYRSGDSQKDIHWGATARTGNLQVKVRDFTVSPRVLLMFNTQISERLWNQMEPEEMDFLENGLNCAAALAAFCIKNGIEVGLRTNGASKLDPDKTISIAPDCANGHLDIIFEELATLVIKMRISFNALLEREIENGTTGMDILVISAYWSEELDKRAARLRALGNSVTHIPVKGGYTP